MDNCCSVTFNYSDVFEKIVRHVIEFHGCRRVNFIAGVKGNAFSEERIEAYKKVLAENGIEFEPERLGYGDFWDMRICNIHPLTFHHNLFPYNDTFHNIADKKSPPDKS